MLEIEKNIRAFLKEKDLTINQFCEKIGIKNPGLYKIFKKGTINTKYVDKIKEI